MPVVPVISKKDIERFIKFEHTVYHANPYWVPALKKDTIRLLSNKSAFSPYIEQQAFYYEKDGRVLARVCIFINHRHIKLHRESTAFFGFFEALPDQQDVVLELLSAAGQWAKQKGMSFLIGPINGDILFGNCLKIDNFDKAPIFPYGYAQPYYMQYFKDFGFSEQYNELCYAIDLTGLDESYLVSRSKQLPDGFTIRPISFDNFRRDHDLVVTVGNTAFADKWYFSSFDLDLSFAYWKELKPLIVRDFLQVVEHNENIVAYMVAFPDYNPAMQVMKGSLNPLSLARFLLKQRTIREGSLLILGVLPEHTQRGFGSALVASTMLAMKRRKYERCYYHTVTEDNWPSRKVAESFGGKVVSSYAGFRIIL